jgi:hypothetical protein
MSGHEIAMNVDPNVPATTFARSAVTAQSASITARHAQKVTRPIFAAYQAWGRSMYLIAAKVSCVRH